MAALGRLGQQLGGLASTLNELRSAMKELEIAKAASLHPLEFLDESEKKMSQWSEEVEKSKAPLVEQMASLQKENPLLIIIEIGLLPQQRLTKLNALVGKVHALTPSLGKIKNTIQDLCHRMVGDRMALESMDSSNKLSKQSWEQQKAKAVKRAAPVVKQCEWTKKMGESIIHYSDRCKEAVLAITVEQLNCKDKDAVQELAQLRDLRAQRISADDSKEEWTVLSEK